MSVVDWVCKKLSLESASERLSAITISRQQALPSKLDACANVTTCCLATQMQLRGYFAGKSHSHSRLVRQRQPQESIKTKTASGNCFCIRVVLSIELRIIVMSTNFEYRERERQEKEKVMNATGRRSSTRKRATQS